VGLEPRRTNAPVIYARHLLDPPAEHVAVTPASLDNSDNRTQSEWFSLHLRRNQPLFDQRGNLM